MTGLPTGKQENPRQSTRVEKREFYRILEQAQINGLIDRYARSEGSQDA